jgi:hypothetical protein
MIPPPLFFILLSPSWPCEMHGIFSWFFNHFLAQFIMQTCNVIVSVILHFWPFFKWYKIIFNMARHNFWVIPPVFPTWKFYLIQSIINLSLLNKKNPITFSNCLNSKAGMAYFMSVLLRPCRKPWEWVWK